MLKKLALLFVAACAAFAMNAAENASAEKQDNQQAQTVPAKAPAKAKAKTKAKAKKAKRTLPADGGLKASTTATPRGNLNAPPTKGWNKRYASKLKQIASYKNNVEIIFLGDSITHFWERQTQTVNGKEIPGGLATFNKYFKKYRLVNFGNSGDRTQHTLWIVEKSGYLDNIKPKMAVLMIGTNNIGHGAANAPATAAGITKIVETLRVKLPETNILLFGIFPRANKPSHAYRTAIKTINDTISKLADNKKVFYCDITDKLLEKDGTLSPTVMPDYLHPNDNGYEIWAQAILPYAEKFVGKK